MNESSLSERLWREVEPLIPQPKSRHKQYAGRKPSDPRRILTWIVFVLTTGVPWRVLPATEAFPSGHPCRRWLLKWQRSVVWNKLSTILLAELRKEGRLNLQHVVVDSLSVRAPGGGPETGPNPTDRSITGTKHHILTDAMGIPLMAIITGANRNDQTQLMPLVEHMPSIGGKKGRPIRKPKALYADRGYDSEPHRRQLKKGIRPFIPKRRTRHGSGLGKKRYVVERTIAHIHQFRKLEMREEHTALTYGVLTKLAFCLIYLMVLLR